MNNTSSDTGFITSTILAHYPNAQAIYLFGSHGTDSAWNDSDVDIGLLLPPDESKRAGNLTFNHAHLSLEHFFGRDVDLINLRQAPTVLQKEIVMDDRRIFCANTYSADEFEMLAISYYQKLNEERADIMAEGLRSGSFYNV